MRNIAIFLFLSALTVPAWAGFQQNNVNTGNGGFVGPGSTAGISTVAQAKSARDDSPCVLTGNIVQRMPGDNEHYLFRDSTGEILVEIDDELFMGRTVTPETQIRIYGEVDNEVFERTKVDVKNMEILK